MPRYYFDTDNGEIDRDAVGVVLPDDDAARVEAIRYLGALLAEQPGYLPAGQPFTASVRDDQDAIIVTIDVRDRGCSKFDAKT